MRERFGRFFNVVDWPIAIKLISVMVLITVGPIATIGHFTNENTVTSLTAQIGETFSELAGTTADEISNELNETLSLMMTVAVAEDVISSLHLANNEYLGSDQEILDQILDLDDRWSTASDFTSLVWDVIGDYAAVNPVASRLHDFASDFPRYVEVLITDKFGANFAATRRPTDYYQGDEDWWLTAFNDGAGGVYIGDPVYDEIAGVTTIDIGLPIMDELGDIIGLLRSSLNFQSIVNVVSGVSVGQTGHAKLVDRNGVVLADADPSHIGVELGAGLQMPGDMMGSRLHWHEGTEDDGTAVIVGHSRLAVPEGGEAVGEVPYIMNLSYLVRTTGQEAIEELGWATIVLIESDEALAPASASTWLTIGLAFVAAAVSSVGGILLTRGLTRQIGDVMELLSNIGIGDFSARAPIRSNDEMGRLATSLNAMLDTTLTLIQTREERDTMQTSVRKLLEEVSGVADGDLTVEAEVTADATGAIADSFNYMITQLRDIISDVQDATREVSSSANEIRVSTEDLSQGSETQAGRLLETSAAVEEMASSIQQVSKSAVTSAEVGNQALANAQQGVLAVQNTIEGMARIRDQVQETAKRIKRLGEGSQEIGEIVQLISEIADRTSILALNASIQAASAGEAGQGFAVVAEEVERLAEQSNEATKRIDGLIRTIQTETTEAVSAMEATTKEVVEGSLLAEEAGHALSEIGTVSTRLSDLIQSISEASEEQARGSETIAKSVSEIAQVTQQTAAGTKQAADSISNLANLADGLRDSVSAFKLPDGDGKVPEAEAAAS
jgi:methyl-accepting chemotaxis protein